MNYATQLAALHHAMVDGDTAPMLTLIKPQRHNFCTPEIRLGVYTSGYTLRLEGAVETDYPALAHYLGKDAFEKSVAAYVKATPSVFWDLNLYTIGFGEFFKTISDDKAAQALAAFESAFTEVYWLPDSDPLDPARLAMLSMDELAQQAFRLRAAARLLALDYAANAYFSAFRDAPVTLVKQPEYLCLIRNKNQVQRLVLEPAEYQLLHALGQGLTFGAALDKSVADSRLVDKLPTYLARWLDIGIFADLS